MRETNNMKIIAMVPVRKGSQRLKYKNLALINNRPLIYYAIKAAKDSKIFDEIFINSDDDLYSIIAQRYKVNFYKRPKILGGSKIKSDDVVLDFVKKNKCDIVVWVNPIAPLQNSSEIRKIVKFFKKNKLNSLITTVEKQVHYSYKNKPINFSLKGKFEQTQDLIPLQEMVYSIMMWTTKSFIKNMKNNKSGILHGKIGYYNVDQLSSNIIKYKNDLVIVENILKAKNKKNYKIKYDKIIL